MRKFKQTEGCADAQVRFQPLRANAWVMLDPYPILQPLTPSGLAAMPADRHRQRHHLPAPKDQLTRF